MNKPTYWLETISTKRIDIPRPSVEEIDPYDIAHAAGMMCRFGGHISHHYPVAEHSLHVSRLVEKFCRGHNLKVQTRSPSYPGMASHGPEDLLSEEDIRKLSLAAHLHDASEALGLADLITPVKRYLEGEGCDHYKMLESIFMEQVMLRFDLPTDFWEHPLVKMADQMMFATERDQLKPKNLGNLHWHTKYDPLPGYDLGLGQEASKKAWLRRFFELCPSETKL